MTSRLTLNMGVRWEMHPSPHPANDYMVTFDVKNNAIATPRPLDYYIQNGFTTPAIITTCSGMLQAQSMPPTFAVSVSQI